MNLWDPWAGGPHARTSTHTHTHTDTHTHTHTHVHAQSTADVTAALPGETAIRVRAYLAGAVILTRSGNLFALACASVLLMLLFLTRFAFPVLCACHDFMLLFIAGPAHSRFADKSSEAGLYGEIRLVAMGVVEMFSDTHSAVCFVTFDGRVCTVSPAELLDVGAWSYGARTDLREV
jgi:hypothetical protein